LYSERVLQPDERIVEVHRDPLEELPCNVSATGVIHVIDAVPAAQRRSNMPFTITSDNNVTAHATLAEAQAVPEAQVVRTAKELAKLAAAWPAERLVEVHNSITGVTPAKKFKDRNTGAARIWKALQPLAEQLAAEAPKKADAPPTARKGAKGKGKASKKAAPAADAPKGEKPPKEAKPARESKAAQVVALMQREGGATLNEIMEKMGWQKHTVRGFMAGAMKKAGHQVESFKPEGGERSYRISK